MTFEEYQEAAQSTAVYPCIGDNAVYPALGMAGDAGEVADKVKKYLRVNGDDPRAAELKDDPVTRAKVLDEMGDTLWYIALLAMELDSSLEEVARRNNEKLRQRADRGVLVGEGDNR